MIAPKDKAQKPIKILLVDDDEMMRIYIRDIFWVHSNEDRYQVETARTFPEAETVITELETRPDLIFLDLMTPIKSGWASPSSSRIEQSVQFVRKLKSNPDTSTIKIIIFSWHRDPGIEKEFADLGVAGYLVKGDLMPKEILEFVDKVVQLP